MDSRLSNVQQRASETLLGSYRSVPSIQPCLDDRWGVSDCEDHAS
jgi:hypothetical protein